MAELNRYVSDGKKENIVRTSVTEFDGDLSYANFTSGWISSRWLPSHLDQEGLWTAKGTRAWTKNMKNDAKIKEFSYKRIYLCKWISCFVLLLYLAASVIKVT